LSITGRPDPVAGELPVAFVVAPDLGEPEAIALMEAVNAEVLPYQRLREVHLVDEIPVSAAGKVLKRTLRERLVALDLHG
jgi:long-chain acyl-CoA synthetase